MYNKLLDRKINDKKVMHKVKKRWVVISTALLMAVGGGALAGHTTVHAAVNNSNSNHIDQQNNTKEHLNSQLVNKSMNSQNQNSKATSAKVAPSQSAQMQQQARGLHNQILRNGFRNSKEAQSRVSAAPQVHNIKNQVPQSNSNNYNINNVSKAQTIQLNRTINPKPVKGSNPNSDSDSCSIYVKYEDVTNHDMAIGNMTSDQGDAGASYPDNIKKTRESLAPQGYKFDHIINDVSKFETGKTPVFIIGVRPKNSSEPTWNRITVRYVDVNHGDIQIGEQGVQSDANGTPFDLEQSERFVPGGYHFVKVVSDATGKDANGNDIFSPGTKLVQIGIALNNSTPKSSTAKMTVRYMNMNNHQDVSDETASGTSGSAFDVTQYEHNVPNGYQFANSTSDVPSHYTNGTTMEIYVTPIASPTKVDRMTVNYVTSDGVTVDNLPTYGTDNSAFDLTPYKDLAPRGYQFSKVLQDTSTYTPNGDARIEVSPVSQSNLAQMQINYQISGMTIDSVPVYGNAGSTFDITPYEQIVPNGYHFVSTSGSVPLNYTNDANIDIELQNNAHATNAHMIINYINKANNQNVGSEVATGISNSSFDPRQYEKNVPQGYTFVSSDDPLPHLYSNGQKVSLYVLPIKSQSIANMNVNYLYRGSSVGHAIASGLSGSHFDIDQYQNNLPSGYEFYNVQGSVPRTYTNGQTININVIPTRQASLVSMPINYINNGQVVGHSSISGISGSQFNTSNLQPYLNNLPLNYDSPSYDTNTLPQTYDASGQIDINVQKVPSVQPTQQGQININYVDPNNNSVGSSETTSSNVGHAFDVQPYEENIPSGYHFVNVKQGASHFAKQSQDVIIEVAPNGRGSHSQSEGVITVSYVKSDGSSVESPMVLKENTNTPFNISNYTENVPSNYHYVGIQQGNNANKFTTAPQSVVIEVAPNKNQGHAEGMITVNYETSDGKSVNTPIALREDTNTPFDIRNYTENVPDGYHYVAIKQGANTNKFTQTSQNVMIEVAKDSTHGGQQAEGMITVSYKNNNGQIIGHPIILQENVDTPFNVNDYTENVPNNYHYVNIEQGNGISKFMSNPQNLVVDVAHNESQQEGQIKVYYKTSNGTSVGNPITLQENVNMPFYIDDYTENVPSNYHYVSIQQGNNINQFTTTPQSVVIEVAPDNGQGHHVEGMITVNYETSDGKSVNTPIVLREDAGTPFNASDYTKNVPDGYHYVSVEQGNGINQFTDAPQNMMIKVAKDASSSSQSHMMIDYVDNQDRVINSLSVNGQKGSKFDWLQYENEVPNGYHATGVYNGPNTFIPHSNAMIQVTPNSQPQSEGHIHINYSYNGQIVGYNNAYGLSGQSFDISPYENEVPSGYQFSGVVSYVPTQFSGNQSQNVTIQVSPMPQPDSNNNQSSMMINYVNAKGNVISSMPVYGSNGSNYSLTQYENNVPNGYHPTGINNGPSVFIPNSSLNIQVAPNSQHVSHNAVMNINYYDNQGHYLDGVTVNGQNGAPFNIQPYEQDAPSGYHFDHIDNPQSTYNNGANMTVVVDPLNNNIHNSGNGNSNNHTIPSNNETPNSNSGNTNGYTPNSYNHSSHLNSDTNRNSNGSNNQQPMDDGNAGTNSENENIPNNSENTSFGNNRVNNVSNGNESSDNTSDSGDTSSTSKLPQTGEDPELDSLGAILATLGASLSELGYAIRKRRHN